MSPTMESNRVLIGYVLVSEHFCVCDNNEIILVECASLCVCLSVNLAHVSPCAIKL